MIKDIHFNGLDEKDTEWVMKRCGLKENAFNNIERIQGATSIILANTDYSNISYQLLRNKSGEYDIYYTLNKKNESRINIGVRFDSEEIASVLLNARTTLKSKLPSYVSGTVRMGKQWSVQLAYGINPSPLSSLSLSYQYKYNDIDYHRLGKKSFTTTSDHHTCEISYHNVWLRNFRFGLGSKWELYDYGRFLHQIGNEGFEVNREYFFSYFANLHYETYDNAYFPSSGVRFHGSYSLNTDNFMEYKNYTPISIVAGSLEGVIPITQRFSILPSAHGRLIFGKNVPFSKMNTMGGDIFEHYLPEQLPFVGTSQVQLMDNSLLIGGIKFRQRIGRIHYLTLAGNYAFESHKIKNILIEKNMFGCAITYGMNSMFGPLEATLNYINKSDNVGFYINLGYKF
jgi:NTE family protein